MNSPLRRPVRKFEPWHTFVTIAALLVTVQVMNLAGALLATAPFVGLTLIALATAAAGYLLLQLRDQARLLLVPAKAPARRRRLP